MPPVIPPEENTDEEENVDGENADVDEGTEEAENGENNNEDDGSESFLNEDPEEEVAAEEEEEEAVPIVVPAPTGPVNVDCGPNLFCGVQSIPA